MINSLHPGVAGNQYSPNFRAARLNILATADNHGNLLSMPQFFNTIKHNKDEIFPKAHDKSTLNVFAIAGDFFINPSKRGFLTYRSATNGEIQTNFLRTLTKSIKELFKPETKFQTVFTPGNHCLDAGDETLIRNVKKVDMTTILTNIDNKKSPLITEEKNEKIVRSKTFAIPDDKDPKMKHHVLFLGVTIPTMDFYNPGLMKKMQFIDNSNRKDSQIKEEDLKKTFQEMNKQVKRFKKKHPQGAVIVMSHTGSPISSLIRDRVPGINEILNGHDHKNLSSHRNNTHISSLGKDNEMVKSINLLFSDKGDLDLRETNTYFTNTHSLSGKETNPLQELLDNTFEKDMCPLVNLRAPQINNELSYGEEIRFSNSYLANYLTTGVKRTIKKVDPEVKTVGIQSSIIRGGIKDKANNLDLMKVFDGVSEDLSKVSTGYVSGKNLVGMITENVLTNLKDKTRNTIIHWSDIQVNRSLIKDISEGNSDKSYFDAIKVRSKNPTKFEDINPNKQYKIAIADKYLVKNDIEYPKKIRSSFTPIHKTYDELFRSYLNKVKYRIMITERVQEKRIL
jgi:hypothetical protein